MQQLAEREVLRGCEQGLLRTAPANVTRLLSEAAAGKNCTKDAGSGKSGATFAIQITRMHVKRQDFDQHMDLFFPPEMQAAESLGI